MAWFPTVVIDSYIWRVTLLCLFFLFSSRSKAQILIRWSYRNWNFTLISFNNNNRNSVSLESQSQVFFSCFRKHKSSYGLACCLALTNNKCRSLYLRKNDECDYSDDSEAAETAYLYVRCNIISYYPSLLLSQFVSFKRLLRLLNVLFAFKFAVSATRRNAQLLRLPRLYSSPAAVSQTLLTTTTSKPSKRLSRNDRRLVVESFVSK